MNMTLEELHRILIGNLFEQFEEIHHCILIGNPFTRLDHVFDESSVDIDKYCEVFKHQLISALESPHQLTMALELIYHCLRIPADSMIRQRLFDSELLMMSIVNSLSKASDVLAKRVIFSLHCKEFKISCRQSQHLMSTIIVATGEMSDSLKEPMKSLILSLYVQPLNSESDQEVDSNQLLLSSVIDTICDQFYQKSVAQQSCAEILIGLYKQDEQNFARTLLANKQRFEKVLLSLLASYSANNQRHALLMVEHYEFRNFCGQSNHIMTKMIAMLGSCSFTLVNKENILQSFLSLYVRPSRSGETDVTRSNQQFWAVVLQGLMSGDLSIQLHCAEIVDRLSLLYPDDFQITLLINQPLFRQALIGLLGSLDKGIRIEALRITETMTIRTSDLAWQFPEILTVILRVMSGSNTVNIWIQANNILKMTNRRFNGGGKTCYKKDELANSDFIIALQDSLDDAINNNRDKYQILRLLFNLTLYGHIFQQSSSEAIHFIHYLMPYYFTLTELDDQKLCLDTLSHLLISISVDVLCFESLFKTQGREKSIDVLRTLIVCIQEIDCTDNAEAKSSQAVILTQLNAIQQRLIGNRMRNSVMSSVSNWFGLYTTPDSTKVLRQEESKITVHHERGL